MAKKTHDLLFKILLIGDSSVEKTQLLFRFTDDTFGTTFISTIGADFQTKLVELNGKKIRLQIMDTIGQERFLTITSAYFRGAMGIMFVYDITQEKTFDHIKKWLRVVQEANEILGPGGSTYPRWWLIITYPVGGHATEDVVKILLGNKCHLEDQRMVSKERGVEFAKENGIKFLETSAKENINVEEAFMTMVADILEKYPQKDSASPGLVKPDTKEGDSSQPQRCF